MREHNYVLINAALWGNDIDIAKQYRSEYISLFRGKAGEELNSVAPFLFSVEPTSWNGVKLPSLSSISLLHFRLKIVIE